MIWLVSRRQRAALLLAAGLVGAFAVIVVLARLTTLAEARELGVESCMRGVDGPACQGLAWARFADALQSRWLWMTITMMVLPALAGTIAGAGLFARELEQGTHLFALTQSVSRLRWWATGLAVAGIPVAVLIGLITLLTGWAIEPFIGSNTDPRLGGPSFSTSGLVPMGYTLLAFTLAATGGLLLRNTYTAIVAGLITLMVVQISIEVFARPNYASPEIVTVALTASSSPSDVPALPREAWRVGDGYRDAAGSDVALVNQTCGYGGDDWFDCVRELGVVETYVRFHPADRYWPFQRAETSLCLALSALVLGGGALLLRRRLD